MTEHLSEAQIERYVTRRATVDELLDAAQHLDACFECRDRAAALVDPGSGEISHTRKRRTSGPRAVVAEVSKMRAIVPAAVGVLIGVLLLVWWLVSR